MSYNVPYVLLELPSQLGFENLVLFYLFSGQAFLDDLLACLAQVTFLSLLFTLSLWSSSLPVMLACSLVTIFNTVFPLPMFIASFLLHCLLTANYFFFFFSGTLTFIFYSVTYFSKGGGRYKGRGKNTQMKHLTVILFIDNSSGVALFCLILQE